MTKSAKQREDLNGFPVETSSVDTDNVSSMWKTSVVITTDDEIKNPKYEEMGDGNTWKQTEITQKIIVNFLN